MNILCFIVCIVGAYLIGAIPFGLLIGKAVRGIDIRTMGSGNIGATNVTRVIGPAWGKVCFFLDFLKSAIPVLAVTFLTGHALFHGRTPVIDDPYCLLPALTTFAAVAGHIWPVYIGFKGGKGVSTAAGAILALNPLSLLAAAIVWVVTFLSGRYVSLASILAAIFLPVFCVVFKLTGLAPASAMDVTLFFLLAILTVLKHTSNIKRLLNGTENRFERTNDRKAENK